MNQLLGTSETVLCLNSPFRVLVPQDNGLSFESAQLATVATERTIEAVCHHVKGKIIDAAVTGAGNLLEESAVTSGSDNVTTGMEVDQVSSQLVLYRAYVCL
jgi:hypothetical protein